MKIFEIVKKLNELPIKPSVNKDEVISLATERILDWMQSNKGFTEVPAELFISAIGSENLIDDQEDQKHQRDQAHEIPDRMIRDRFMYHH